MVVNYNKVFNPLIEFLPVFCRMQVYIIIFQGAPKSLYKNVVNGSTPSIHANQYTLLFDIFYQFFAGKLTTLVGVDYLRFTIIPYGLGY